jgi:hypothetical protein
VKDLNVHIVAVDEMERSIYLDREDAQIIEEEERNVFLREVLEEIGVPLEEVWPDILLTVEQKIKLRNLLSKLEIEIIHDGDRGYTVYHQDNKLGEWFKPRFLLRKNKKARNLSKKLYYEMVIKTWTIFDEFKETKGKQEKK